MGFLCGSKTELSTLPPSTVGFLCGSKTDLSTVFGTSTATHWDFCVVLREFSTSTATHRGISVWF